MELVLLIGFGVASLIVWIVVQRQRSHDHARRVWRSYAERFGARLDEPEPSRFADPPVRLSLRRGGMSLTAELDGLSQPKTAATKVTAEVRGASGFELRIFREDALSVLSRAMGFRDILVGDAAFDRDYHVRSNNVDLTRIWLEPEVQERLRRCEDYHFAIIRGEACAERVGAELSPFRLGDVFEAVASLARGGERLLKRSRVLAAELDGVISAPGDAWEPNGKVLTVLDRRGCQVLVDALSGPGEGAGEVRIWTRLRARPLQAPEPKLVVLSHRGPSPPLDLADLHVVAIDDDRFTALYSVISSDPERAGTKLSAEVRARIQRQMPALVTSDDREVTLLLPGLIFDAPALEAAIDLAVDLSSPSPGSETSGPYR